MFHILSWSSADGGMITEEKREESEHVYIDGYANRCMHESPSLQKSKNYKITQIYTQCNYICGESHHNMM